MLLGRRLWVPLQNPPEPPWPPLQKRIWHCSWAFAGCLRSFLFTRERHLVSSGFPPVRASFSSLEAVGPFSSSWKDFNYRSFLEGSVSWAFSFLHYRIFLKALFIVLFIVRLFRGYWWVKYQLKSPPDVNALNDTLKVTLSPLFTAPFSSNMLARIA